MAHPSFVALGRSPLGRAGLAIFSILALAAVAGGIIPMTCQAGASFCAGEEQAQAAPDGLVAAAVPEPIASAAALVEVTAAAPEPDPAGFIADTFATLEAGLVAAPKELTARKVQTVDVGPDGLPLKAPPPLVAEAVASEPPAAPEPEPEPEPEASASAEPAPAAAEPAPVPAAPAPDPSPSLAYAPATGDAATVTGQGANVRSQPQMTGSEVLFALRGGADVTIADMHKGWAHIVDENGRSGWIYGKYLKRQ